MKRFGTLPLNLACETVYVRTANWITGDCHGTEISHGLTIFLGFDFWIWLLTLRESLFARIKNFYTGFCFKFISIKGPSSGIYFWNYSGLHVGTWIEHLRGFLQGICFFDQGLYRRILLAIKSGTFVRNCFCEGLGTIFRDFVLNFYAIKGFCEGVCFRDLQFFL